MSRHICQRCPDTSHGALEGIRTPNLLIRSQMLYPIELQNPRTFIQKRVQIYVYFSELQILITFFY